MVWANRSAIINSRAFRALVSPAALSLSFIILAVLEAIVVSFFIESRIFCCTQAVLILAPSRAGHAAAEKISHVPTPTHEGLAGVQTPGGMANGCLGRSVGITISGGGAGGSWIPNIILMTLIISSMTSALACAGAKTRAALIKSAQMIAPGRRGVFLWKNFSIFRNEAINRLLHCQLEP